MLKQLTASILLITVLLQILDRAFVYIDYYSNMAAYVKSCENKARPQMHCNGKCQMMKKLQEQEKKDQQLPEKRSVNEVVITGDFSYTAPAPWYCIESLSYNTIPSPATIEMPRSFFHPPGYNC